MSKYLIFFIFNSYALNLEKPLMYIRALDFFKFQKKHSCLTPKDTLLSKSRESFLTTISCEYKCQKQKNTQYKVIEKVFEPRMLSLAPGNGSSKDTILWRSLGITLQIFKNETCFKIAQKSCKQIDYFKAKKISSGTWSLESDLSCRDSKLLLSPFDKSFELKQQNSSISNLNFFSNFNDLDYTVKANNLSEFIRNDYDLRLLKKNNCVQKVKVNTCFGDCIFEADNEVGFVETISTPKSFGEDSFSICIDHLALDGKPKSVREFKCEKVIWEYMRFSKAIGESCAAVRFDHNCSDVFN